MNNIKYQISKIKNKSQILKILIFLMFIFSILFTYKRDLNIGKFDNNQFENHILSVNEISLLLGRVKNNIKFNEADSVQLQDNELNGLNSYVVIDADTGDILAGKDIHNEVSVASLTKLMTAVVAIDLADKSDLFKVSKTAANITPTRIGVVPGQKMTLEELLNAMLITSANDAAQVIMEGVNTKYKSNVFVMAMNKKVAEIGLRNSYFTNPQGFDVRNNRSSAYDLAILSKYAISNYPLISEIVKKDYAFLPADKNHKMFDLYNWNGLLDVYPGARGVKIGNTEMAGSTSIEYANRNGKNILVVVLGATDVKQRDLLAAKLLDFGFEKTLGLNSANITADMLNQKYSTWKYFN